MSPIKEASDSQAVHPEMRDLIVWELTVLWIKRWVNWPQGGLGQAVALTVGPNYRSRKGLWCLVQVRVSEPCGNQQPGTRTSWANWRQNVDNVLQVKQSSSDILIRRSTDWWLLRLIRLIFAILTQTAPLHPWGWLEGKQISLQVFIKCIG